MADTSHLHATPPVEGDGVNYRGIVWFIVVLTATTLFCQALVWGMFEFMQYRVRRDDPARAPLSAPPTNPAIVRGHVDSGTIGPAPPNLIVNEPTVLGDFRQAEDHALTTYGWMDKANGVVRLPIDRAKALILEHGLPTRQATPVSAPAAAAKTPAAVPSQGSLKK